MAISSGPTLPQGSKLVTYMNNRPQQQQQDLTRNLQTLQIEKQTTKKSSTPLTLSGVQEFYPASFTASNGGRHASGGAASFSSAASGSPFNRGGGLSGPSPRQSPTPSNATSGAADAVDVSTFIDGGGTTYFYNPGDELPGGGGGGGPGGGGISNGANGVSAAHMANGGGVGGPGSHAGVGGGSVLLPDYSVYAGTPSHVAAQRVRANAPGFVAESEIKMDILKKQHICLAQIDPESYPNLPTDVDNFTNLCPLEPPPANPLHKSHTFGYVTSVYKATNMKTSAHVCLRRIHGYRLVNTKCMNIVDQWKKLSHANLVSLRQVFTTKSFADHSMVFVYDLYAGAETLMSKHFNSPSQVSGAFLDPFGESGPGGGGGPGGGPGGPAPRPFSAQKSQMLRQQAMLANTGLLPESLIWTYVIQLTSAIRHIHSHALACRTLDPTKILVVNKTRLLLNCGGIFDVITFDPANSPTGNNSTAMSHFQQEDLISLGKIVLALSCNSFLAIQRENLQTSMEIVTSTYSSDLRNLIMYLLTNPTRVKSVSDLMPMIGARFYAQLDAAYGRNDSLECELAKEVESARLFRLLTKLSTVVDRAELNGDFGWSEYGDRYMLKLFRDYVFHQVMEDSRPWLDMAHVVSSLNRLDAGVPDKVCLMSRDEQNVLVVSYGELKHCLEQSFAECVHSQKPAIPGMTHPGNSHHGHALPGGY